MNATEIKVVADTNVLFPARLRDLLVQLSLDGGFELAIPANISEELTKVWIREGLSPAAAQKISERLSAAFHVETGPVAEDASVYVSDPGDKHIVEALLWLKPSIFITYNTRDFNTQGIGVLCSHPDEFLVLMLEREPNLVLAAVERVRNRYRQPPLSSAEFEQALSRLGLRDFVAQLRIANSAQSEQ